MTYLAHMDFYGVSRKNLSEPMQAKLKEWRRELRDPTPRTKYGLWVFGDRLAGTSYVGYVAGGRLAFMEGYSAAERVTAVKMLQELRATWSAGQVMRTNADDVGLYWEATMAEDTFNGHFDADLLWIDDLHHETIDMPMWKKHIQPLLEDRVKNKLPTIVCTTMAPDDPALPKGVVEGLFTTARCTGFRPEVDHYRLPTFD